MSETIDPTKTTASVEAALTSPLHLPHDAAACPKCFTELQQNRKQIEIETELLEAISA